MEVLKSAAEERYNCIGLKLEGDIANIQWDLVNLEFSLANMLPAIETAIKNQIREKRKSINPKLSASGNVFVDCDLHEEPRDSDVKVEGVQIAKIDEAILNRNIINLSQELQNGKQIEDLASTVLKSLEERWQGIKSQLKSVNITSTIQELHTGQIHKREDKRKQLKSLKNSLKMLENTGKLESNIETLSCKEEKSRSRCYVNRDTRAQSEPHLQKAWKIDANIDRLESQRLLAEAEEIIYEGAGIKNNLDEKKRGIKLHINPSELSNYQDCRSEESVVRILSPRKLSESD